jgi:hypothetical protein
MGSSTLTLQAAFNYVAAKGVPTPLQQPAGYGTELALQLGSDVMNDLISERFNWKWNQATAAPFYTNSYQQDYPQIGLVNVGWLEDADRIDINNTQFPKPLRNLTVRRGLSRTNAGWKPVEEICWLYNSQMTYGTWPGAGVTFYPLVSTSPVLQNPLMSMIDTNGNLLIVTTIGTTGTAPPALPALSPEGTTVTDGTAVWTVVSPSSQGFRVNPLPGPTGPVWKIVPYYQMLSVTFATLKQTIAPIPNDYSTVFLRGLEYQCKGASPEPADRREFAQEYPKWLAELANARKQGDRENDAYGMLPMTSPVESVYGYLRNPQDPSQPY